MARRRTTAGCPPNNAASATTSTVGAGVSSWHAAQRYPATRRWGLLITRDLRTSTKQQPAEPGELRGGVLSVRLKFIRLIGAGGMGQVWEAASDDLPGQRFAVKVVAAEHAKDPRTVSRFFGEARAAGAIDDPNIVMVYGTGRTDDGRPALVMPYIEGQSLADMCDERGPLPLDAVGKIMLQLASAVRAAHGAGIEPSSRLTNSL